MKGILHRFTRTPRAAMIAACCVVLTACDSGSSTISPPIDDSAGSNEQIITSQISFRESGAAIQRFELNEDMVSALKYGVSLAIGVDHPEYSVAVDPLPTNIRTCLTSDLL